MKDYPSTIETDKLISHSEHGQIIGQFIDWLSEAPHFGPSSGDGRRAAIRAQKLNAAPVRLCLFDEKSGEWIPVRLTIEEMLARYFDIDLDTVEKERSAVLEWVREQARIKKKG
jgi:hypothetical protein